MADAKILEWDVTAFYLFCALGLKRPPGGPNETLGNLWCSIQRDERSRTRSALVLAWKGEGRRTFTFFRSQGRCFRPKAERRSQSVLGQLVTIWSTGGVGGCASSLLNRFQCSR